MRGQSRDFGAALNFTYIFFKLIFLLMQILNCNFAIVRLMQSLSVVLQVSLGIREL